MSDFKGVGIELGVSTGWFSDRILKLSGAVRLYSVDMWGGDRGHTINQYAKACELLNYHGERSVVIRAKFSEALNLFCDNSLDFVYIDGYAHTGQENGKTLHDWWEKLKVGGIFSGHDYCQNRWPKTFDAVNKFLKQHDLELNGFTNDKDPSWYLKKPPMGGFPPDVLLIGNSPESLKYSRGSEIDSFDGLVVRFNGATTEGYEKNIGKRTDIWCTWGGCQQPHQSIGEPKQILLSIPTNFNKKCLDVWNKYKGRPMEAVREDTFYRVKNQIGHHPSSGAVVVEHFVKNGHRVYIHGFSHFNNSQKHHYWESDEVNKDHSSEKEEAWFNRKKSIGLVHTF